MNEAQKNAIREADNYLKAAGLPTYSDLTTSQPAQAGEVEKLRADAERYRWLKSYDQNGEDIGICKWVDEGWAGQWVIEHNPDAVIDAALDAARTTHKS